MTDTPPDPPQSLGEAGRALWTTIVTGWSLDAREVAILAAAAAQADTVAALEADVVAVGLKTVGSTGQERLNPSIAELRQARASVARLLGALHLPAGEDRPTARSKYASHAASTRWAKHRG